MTAPAFTITPEFETFERSYIAALLFADLPEENSELDEDDFSESAVKQVRADCVEFFTNYSRFWGNLHSEAGHDFWLTRQGHGAGFWDRGELYDGSGDLLTKASEQAGVCDLYIGDDSKIYLT